MVLSDKGTRKKEVLGLRPKGRPEDSVWPWTSYLTSLSFRFPTGKQSQL